MKTCAIKAFILTVFLGFVITLNCIAQISAIKYNLKSLFENDKLEVYNRNVTPFTDKDIEGIRFSKNENDGVAWLKHIIFSNGSIELDIKGKDELQQSFVGVAFHGINNDTYDAIYFRPFNFQTPDTVRKIHAVQYVSEPDFSWQVLREKFNGIYEKEIIPAPKGNDWFHVKIVIKSPQITVYLNGNPKPCLSVEKLNNRASGKIGLWVGNNSDGDFANVMIYPQN
jgi:hypothetical protein